MPTYTQESIQSLIAKQRAAAAIVEKGCQTADELEIAINKDLEGKFKKFGKVSFFVSFTSGSTTKNWQPHISIYYVFVKGKKHIKIENEGWVVAPSDHDTELPTRDKFGAAEQDFSDFNNFCKELETDLGIPVEFVEYKVFDVAKFIESDRMPSNSQEALAKHGGKILLAGEKYHKGWDIPDNWVIVEDSDQKRHVYFTSSGHGSAFEKYIPPGGNLEPFFDLLGGEHEAAMNKIFPLPG